MRTGLIFIDLIITFIYAILCVFATYFALDKIADILIWAEIYPTSMHLASILLGLIVFYVVFPILALESLVWYDRRTHERT